MRYRASSLLLKESNRERERGGGRERGRQRQRQRQTETDRDRQRERGNEREREVFQCIQRHVCSCEFRCAGTGSFILVPRTSVTTTKSVGL